MVGFVLHILYTLLGIGIVALVVIVPCITLTVSTMHRVTLSSGDVTSQSTPSHLQLRSFAILERMNVAKLFQVDRVDEGVFESTLTNSTRRNVDSSAELILSDADSTTAKSQGQPECQNLALPIPDQPH